MISDPLDRLPLENSDPDVDFVVGALVFNSKGQVFVQKRALTRKLFPGCWDIVGGHVEAGETLTQALEREIQEETGWSVLSVGPLIQEFRWESRESGKTRKKIEYDFVVEAAGDLEHPCLEHEKHTEFAWLDEGQIEVLNQQREADDTFIFEVVRLAFQKRRSVSS